MKSLIITSTIALGLACAGSISAAQDQTQATSLQNLTVTAPVGQYETYVVDLHTGYGLAALVGNTHRQYVQAARAAERSEALRKMGMAEQSVLAVAIDNSDGLGVAKRFLVSDSSQSTVAIVDVYCKRVSMTNGKHCIVFSRGFGQTHDQRVASAKKTQNARTQA
ncbi:hypothetical protein [Dyella sp.]|uniref:hypothetical protein n=1 Tax=Dyella sp. TaxID=1869338 RepID=UPI002B4809A6|nr:hypothetical protein [Dyella sp.]HKT27268.1 hypothetical protein [Dyella sp.]